MAREAEWRVGDFNPQNLASTAMAFATICTGHPHAPLLLLLFTTLAWKAKAEAAERCIGDFNRLGLASLTACVFATMEQQGVAPNYCHHAPNYARCLD